MRANRGKLFSLAGLVLAAAVLSAPVVAGEKQLDVFNYDDLMEKIFWDELYPTGGWTLYCGYHFNHDRKTDHGKPVVIDHIYPTSWMFRQLGCRNRLQCRSNDNGLFKRMEADMHNLYPVWQALVVYRYDNRYGEIPGEDWRFKDCDFEWQGDISEPRPMAWGNIARAMFYMHSHYGLPLDQDMLKTLKKWNRNDPPSKQEMSRNDRIEQIQGTRNPYIDNPGLADQLR